MKRNKKTHFQYYVNTLENFIIYTLLILFLLGIALIIFAIFHIILIRVFQVEEAVGDLVSLSVSILLFIVPLFPQIKSFYTRLINIFRQKIYRITRRRTLPQDMITTSEQATVINKALGLLQDRSSHLIAIESDSGRGKTMTAVLLIDNIGNDDNLLQLFIQLQKHICYFDAGSEKNFLIEFLNDKNIAARSLIIIDNMHKLSSEALHAVFDKITAVSEYANNINSKNFIMLLYQSIQDNDATGALLREYLSEHSFSLEAPFYDLKNNLNHYSTETNINHQIDSDGIILYRIRTECCDLLRIQLLNIYTYAHRKSLLKFLMRMFEDDFQINSQEEAEQLKFIAIITLACMYLGFVTKSSIIKIWNNIYPKSRNTSCYQLIRYFSENKFMLPFPLIQNAFLFNENLALEYKSRLFHISSFRDYYYQSAYYVYKNNLFHSAELNWLFLITCQTTDYKSVPLKIREQCYDTCIGGMNKNYILKILEEELRLDPNKQPLLQKELGILYIKTGRWFEARNIFKTFISTSENTVQIWKLQLQIIEANHGVDDAENLAMLNNIISKSDDSYIIFQAKYWTAHIDMELGNFSLVPWINLQVELQENLYWNSHSTYAHIVHRITADTCRTFFLKGENVPDIFNSTMAFFKKFRKVPILQEDLALEELEQAHYIHYELVYQLGIWQMYRFKHDTNVSHGDAMSLTGLVEKALVLYDGSINKFLKAGIKTWRTAQIRRDELALSVAAPNFVEILSHLDDFVQYSLTNHVDVFVGYVECLKGKALASYALNESIGINNNQYERHLEGALLALQKSIDIYTNYGNKFGVLRSKLLYTLVDTVYQSGTVQNSVQILERFAEQIKKFQQDFEKENSREQQVLTYLASKETRIGDLANVIKYYPIVLQ